MTERFTEQILILVDEDDNFLGYASREECHIGEGKRHRAFVTLLFDDQNRVTLQKRKHKLFDNLWDLTAISHPLHLADRDESYQEKSGAVNECFQKNLHLANRDESYQEASDRALKREMGIGHVLVKKVGAFNYFAKDGADCENEYCTILVGKYDGDYQPNKDEVYEVKQMAFNQFVADVEANPSQYTPWAVLAVKELSGDEPGLKISSKPGSKKSE